jgi:hypothetical protein
VEHCWFLTVLSGNPMENLFHGSRVNASPPIDDTIVTPANKKRLIKKNRLTKEKHQKKKMKMKTHLKEKRLKSSSSSKSIDAIVIELDTHKLLSGLVDQEVAHVVDDPIAVIASSSSNSATVENQLNQSASFLAMPPPNPRAPNDPHSDEYQKISSKDSGQKIISKATSALPIVSPYISAPMAELHPIPVLHLGLSSLSVEAKENYDDEEDVSYMSADQCAAIVDSIFGEGVDDSVFHMIPPPIKRARIRS